MQISNNTNNDHNLLQYRNIRAGSSATPGLPPCDACTYVCIYASKTQVKLTFHSSCLR